MHRYGACVLNYQVIVTEKVVTDKHMYNRHRSSTTEINTYILGQILKNIRYMYH